MHAQAMSEILNVRVTPEDIEALLDGYEDAAEAREASYAAVNGAADAETVDIDMTPAWAEHERGWALDRTRPEIGAGEPATGTL